MIVDLHQDLSLRLLSEGNKKFLTSSLRNDPHATYGQYGLIDQVAHKDLYQNNFKIVFGSSCALTLSHKGITVPKKPLKELLRHINAYLNLAKESNEKIEIVTSFKNYEDFKKTQINILLSIEGLYCLEEDNYKFIIDNVYGLGVRSIGPFWNLKNNLGGSGDSNYGLTLLGKKIVEYLNEKNIIIDGSHASKKSLSEILTFSKKSIIVSHALSKSIYNHFRNLEDGQIKKISNLGGLIGICFVAEFTGGNNLDLLIKHIKYFAKVGSINSIAIGSDFGTMFDSHLIQGLENVNKISFLENSLRKAGFKNSEIEKILWKNALNFLKANLR